MKWNDPSQRDVSEVPEPFHRNDAYAVTRWRRSPWRRAFTRDHIVAPLASADVISSRDTATGRHRVLLDMDFPSWVLPSSTPGHFHLYIDNLITWRQYRRVLRAFYRAGMLEKKYVVASRGARATMVRVPWLRKSDEWEEAYLDDRA